MRQTQTKRWILPIVFVALVVTATSLVFQRIDPAALQVLRMKQLDIFQQILPRESKPFPISIVDIDDASLKELGQWPWARTRIAELVTRVIGDGAAVIGFDVVFSEHDRMSPDVFASNLKNLDEQTRRTLSMFPSNDQILAMRMKNSRVVLGQAAVAEELPETISKKARKAAFGSKGGNPKDFVYRLGGLIRNIPELENEARGIGTTTIIPEVDHVVRRIPVLWRVGDQLYPSLGLEMLRVATGKKVIVTKANALGLESVIVAGLEIPTDAHGQSWVRYNDHDPARFVSARDVVAGTFPKGRFKGHLVLVGASASGLQDVKKTPLAAAMPGVEIHAQWLETVLSKSFLQRPSYIPGAEYMMTAGICLILTMSIPLLGALPGLLIGFGSTVAVTATSWYLFAEEGILLGMIYPALSGLTLYILMVMLNYFREETQRREIRSAFSHYLSPDLVSEIAADPGRLELSGESRELTFLFTDLAGFTSLVEGAEPDQIVSLLNEYLDGTCAIVMKHGGTIDKIVGDAIHAMFGAPTEQVDHAGRAVACALELDAFCREFEDRKHEEGIPFGITRIGINSGRAVVGNFGGASRFDYTAHGDAINSAARLESVNKHLGTRICISASTANQCNGLLFRPVGNLVMKGKTEPVRVFEPVSATEWDSPEVQGYLKAFTLLERKDPTAQGAFAKYPDDPLAAFHLDRLARGETGSTVVMAAK